MWVPEFPSPRLDSQYLPSQRLQVAMYGTYTGPKDMIGSYFKAKVSSFQLHGALRSALQQVGIWM